MMTTDSFNSFSLIHMNLKDESTNIETVSLSTLQLQPRNQILWHCFRLLFAFLARRSHTAQFNLSIAC